MQGGGSNPTGVWIDDPLVASKGFSVDPKRVAQTMKNFVAGRGTCVDPQGTVPNQQAECTTAGDCDDSNACTVDTCDTSGSGVGGVCVHVDTCASEAPSAALPMPSRGAPLSSSHETLRVFASPESKPRAPRPFSSKVRICTRFRVTKKRERSINRVNSPKFTFEKSWISKPLGEHFEFREPPTRTVPSRGRRLERSPRRARCRDEACARGRPCPTKRTT